MKLTRGIFFAKEKTLFGMKAGQVREGVEKLVFRAGWYNAMGDLLGYGDIATYDLFVIQKKISEPELFVIVPEPDSEWAPTDFGCFRDRKQLSFATPHQGSLAEKCCLVVVPGRTYSTVGFAGLTEITRTRAVEIIKSAAEALLKFKDAS